MSKKIILIFVLLFFFFGFKFVWASVVINEVQLDPTNERFIELYNSGSSVVDLTDWYIQRKTATGTTFGSLVTKTDFGNKTINANSYFLISRTALSNSDIVLGDMTLTESNTIQIKDSDGNVVDKVGWGDCGDTCVAGNPAEGQSIQRQSDNSWKICDATPGAQNSSCDAGGGGPTGGNGGGGDENPGGGSSSENTDSSNNNNDTKLKTTVAPTMKAKILASTLAFAGQPLEIKTNISGYSNENIVLGRAYWNFGDGGTFEQINNFERFYHTYYYPGEYVLFLEYYQNIFSKTPEATNKIIIKVLPTTVSISKVGDVKDFFVELTNNATSDIDISNWTIRANRKTFFLPRNSIVMSKKQMTISGKITGLTYGDQNDLKLYSSTGELAFDYNHRYSPTRTSTKNTNQGGQIQAKNVTEEKIMLANAETNPADQISSDNLLANALKTDSSGEGPTKNSYLFLIPLILLLALSGTAVYFIRKKKAIRVEEDDFEILDE